MVHRNKVGDSQDDQRSHAGKRLFDLSSQKLVEGRNRGSDSNKTMKRSASTKLSDVADIISLPSRKNTAQPARKKPFSSTASQFPEGRKKGSESNKSEKKPTSIKLSDVDDLISLPRAENNIAQPGKPPASTVVEVAVISKATGGSPNYMKPTSCSDARKDAKQQVSIHPDVNSNTTCEKNQARRIQKSSKPDQAAPGRSSGLRLGRTLTKTPSFKQAGSLKNGIAKAALCSDIHVQRATCSSLLKDSKFPSHVMLQPGATESHGTSLIKVCTYKYCSLNGHHHTLVPPLRSFASARRRSLKNQQRSMKPDDGAKQDTYLEENTTKGVKCLAGSGEKGVEFSVGIHCNELSSEPTGDGADDHEDDNRLIGIQKTLIDLEYDDLLTESNAVDAENKTEQNPSDGWLVDDDYGNTLESENDESPLLTKISGVKGSSDVESDEDLKSIWEAYEFIDGHLDEQVNLKIGNEAEFSCKSESSFDGSIIVSVLKKGSEDELEGGWQEENENFEEQLFQDYTEVEEMTKKEETGEDNKSSESQNYDHLTCPGDMSEELVAAQQTSDYIDDSVVLTSVVDVVDAMIAASKENIAAYEAENQNAEDFYSYANSRTEPADQDSNELNKEDDDQDESKDDWLVSEFPLNFCDLDQKDAESEITSDGERVEQDSISPDCIDRNEDEENVTEKVTRVHQSNAIHELVSPESADYMAEGTEHSDNCEGKWCEGATDGDGDDEDNYQTGATHTNSTIPEAGNASFKPKSNTNQEFLETCSCLIRTNKCKEAEEAGADDTKGFNPAEPNHLPLEPEAEVERVDLRHQIIDGRKNSEEWMVDYALQKTVTKLAPVKRKKVPLLVEAFETVA
uniref:Calmodulin-binding domain-containing protein n=1 Tax=Kalanchoe fedtschenkoi TaxID=63787 RepID=A0A7N0RAM6_KALFE